MFSRTDSRILCVAFLCYALCESSVRVRYDFRQVNMFLGFRASMEAEFIRLQHILAATMVPQRADIEFGSLSDEQVSEKRISANSRRWVLRVSTNFTALTRLCRSPYCPPYCPLYRPPEVDLQSHPVIYVRL
jgi:hypothetical protein